MSSVVEPATPSDEGVVVVGDERTHTETRGLRLAHLWVLVPFVVAWFAGSIDTIEPFDFWWNVKSGEIMAQTGRFLGTDVLVWTPVREPYMNPQWLSQLIFYWTYSASPYLLLTLRTLIIVGTLGFVFWLCLLRTHSTRIAALATLVAYLTAWTNYGMRPQLFAFLPFVLFLALLERKDTHPAWLPLLVPAMLFWVNAHGSFFLGVALIAIYAFGTILEKATTAEGRRWLRSWSAGWQATWMGAAVLVTLANPYFVDIYRYFFIATNDPIARSLNIEWQPPTLYDGTGQLFFANLLLFGASVYFGRRRLKVTEILLVLAFGYLSLTSLRNVMWWAWVVAPIMAANFAAWGAAIASTRRRTGENGLSPTAGSEPSPGAEPVKRELPALNWAIAVLLVGGAVAFTPLWRPANPLVPQAARGALAPTTPTKLAGYLKSADVPAPIFNYMEWGGYLEWELYPRYPMFIDGRFEARRISVWQDYLATSKARADWQGILDSYGVRTLVLNKEFHSALLPFVNASTQWRKVYDDTLAVVFVRR